VSNLDEATLNRLLKLGAQGPEVLFKDHESRDPVIVVPQDMKIESLAKFYPPKRVDQRVTLLEAGSFIDYVNRFKDKDTLIFSDVSESGVTFKAILDYHQPPEEKQGLTAKARYCKHVATFNAVETPEWKVWGRNNRVIMTQLEFAEFLENNLQLFVEPKGAELLELVRTLHGHSNARFNTSLRLDNGAYSASYEEDVSIKGSAGSKSGDIKLPPEIAAGFAIFQGAEPYKIKARLKCRIVDRQLKLYFETIQLPNIVRDSIMLLVKQVSTKTGIVPLLGAA
jgi:uncharacterized protein YfdQ (DUF2303 family)